MPDKEINNLLKKAVDKGNTAEVKTLIEKGANPNTKNEDGHTVLRSVCGAWKANYVADIVKILLEAGADPNLYKKGTDGPLHYATMFGYPKAVKLLIDYKAEIDVHGEYGRTPLIYAAMSGKNAAESVKYLLEAGADLELKNEAGENALFELITSEDSNPEAAEMLVAAGINLNYIGHYGSVLHWAAFCGRLNVIKVLIEGGIDVNIENKSGEKAITRAFNNDKLEIVKYLFEKGADPNSKSGFGTTLLEFASESGDTDFVNRILAKQKKNKPKHKTGALAAAAKKGDLKMVELLINSGFDIEEQESWGSETALIKAAYYGKSDVVKFLLKRGANIKAVDYRGNTALLNAAWSGHLNVVKMLLKSGADINERNKYNWNALMQACVEGHYSIAKFLLEKGSPFDEIDKEKGATALSLAKLSGNQKLIKLMEEYGAKEREIKKRRKNQAYFSIFECDYCKYFSHKKDLGRTEMPEHFEGLEIIIETHETPDRYCNDTNYVKRCKNCGTYYHQYHSVDYEDSFISGPSVSHNFQRYNLLKALDILKAYNKTKEYNILEKQYPKLIERFTKEITNNHKNIQEKFLPYITENLSDYYILRNDWASLSEILLKHENPVIALKVADSLCSIYGMKSWGSNFPFYAEYRYYSKEIREKLIEMIKNHKNEFKQIIEQHKKSKDEQVKFLYKQVNDSVKYYKVYSLRNKKK